MDAICAKCPKTYGQDCRSFRINLSSDIANSKMSLTCVKKRENKEWAREKRKPSQGGRKRGGGRVDIK